MLLAAILAMSAVPHLAAANNVGENVAWQFESWADKANKAFIEDMRQKKKSGYYAAPIYNTTIDRQYNCSVSALAAGSQSTSSAVGNAQTISGHSAQAAGNTDTANVAQGNAAASTNVSSNQSNTGLVGAYNGGEVEANAHVGSYQVLNTEQENSGNQAVSIRGSDACQFASAD